MDLPQIEQDGGTKYYLQLFAYTKTANQFIPAGFEVAKVEFRLKGGNYFTKGLADGAAVKKRKQIQSLLLWLIN